MLDEYALDPLAALAALDDAEKRYGPRLELARQRAKVLYRKGDHAASLDVVRAIGDQLDPKDRVERAFAFRSAGISAAELGDWEESVLFFAKAREAAVDSEGDLASMAVGLLGDMAVSKVRGGNVKAGLEYLRQALEELAQFDPPVTDAQRYTRHLIGHVPVWMENELFPPTVRQEFQILAPGKCSQPDPIPVVLERPIYPIEVNWYQLARVELRTDQDVGIRATIKAWPDARKILSLEGVLSNADVGYFMRNRRLGDFKEALLDEASSLILLAAAGTKLRDESFNDATRGAFERLPLSRLQSGDTPAIIFIGVLGYALSCLIAGDTSSYDELLALDTCDLAKHPVFREAASALAGQKKPDDDTRLRMAQYFAQLRGGEDDLTPLQLVTTQCHTLVFLRHPLLEEALMIPFADWMCRSWLRILAEETFRLRRPSATVPLVQAAISNSDKVGCAKAASILLVADEAVGSPLSTEFRQQFSDMARATP